MHSNPSTAREKKRGARRRGDVETLSADSDSEEERKERRSKRSQKNNEIDSDSSKSSELSDLLEKNEDNIIQGVIQARVEAAMN